MPGGGAPDTEVIRAARHNIRYHLAYIGWLVRARDWLAGNRADLCRPRRRRASVGGRLSGRCAVERRRNSEELVRAAEVAAVVPAAADRDHGRHPAVKDLRRSRLLNDPAALKAALADAARAQGFDVVGVTRPDSIPQALERLRQFLAEGAHGDMDWMETTAARRGDPRALWPEVRSVIMLGMNYGPDADPLAILQAARRAARSRSMRRATTITRSSSRG